MNRFAFATTTNLLRAEADWRRNNRQHGFRSVLFTVALTFAIVPMSHSDPVMIELRRADYATHVRTSVYSETNGVGYMENVSRTNFSTGALTDSTSTTGAIVLPGLPAEGHALAQASLFGLAVEAGSFGATAGASALTQFRFSPVLDATSTPSFVAAGWGNLYLAIYVGLYDLTLGQEVWSYGWSRSGGNSVMDPHLGVTFDYQASLPLSHSSDVLSPLEPLTDFASDHTYELTMYVASSAANDWTRGQLELSGLEVIPEPSTYVLIVLGWVALMLFHSAKRHGLNC